MKSKEQIKYEIIEYITKQGTKGSITINLDSKYWEKNREKIQKRIMKKIFNSKKIKQYEIKEIIKEYDI